MNLPFLKKKHQDKISDVISGAKTTVLKLGKHPFFKAEFQPERVRSLFKRFEFFWGALLMLVVGSLVWSLAPFTHAEVSTFYPNSCLGGWENPSYATGAPSLSLDNSTVSDFTKDNSAFLVGSGEIYCGDFKGSIPKNGIPKKFTLRISWSVDDGNILHDNPLPVVEDENLQIDQQNASDFLGNSDLEDLVPTLDIIKSTVDIPDILPESIESQVELSKDVPIVEDMLSDPTPVPTSQVESAPAEESGPQSFLFDLFTKYALAQSIDDTSSIIADEKQGVQISQDDPFLDPIAQDQLAPVDDAISVETKDETILPSEDTIVPSLTEPDKPNGFMEVLYTLDGKDWSSLGIVDRNDWHNISFSLPITEWTDLSKLQISLKPLTNIDPYPVVYLDAMILDVEYEIDSEENITNNLYPFKVTDIINKNDKLSISAKGGFENPVQITITTSMDSLGNIVLFNADTKKIVLNTWTDEKQYVADPSYLGVGAYVVVLTNDPDSCSSISFDECLTNTESISNASFSVVLNIVNSIEDSGNEPEDVSDAVSKEQEPPINYQQDLLEIAPDTDDFISIPLESSN